MEDAELTPNEGDARASSPRGVRRVLRVLFRVTLRAVLGFLIALGCYLGAACVLGLIPRNSDWTEAENGVEIYVISNGVHVDFVLPARSGGRDWTRLLPLSADDKDRRADRERTASWVRFGWGERRFYLETPTWADLKWSTALAAIFWPTPTLMHVTYDWGPPILDDATRRLRVRDSELQAIVEHIEARFARDQDGKPRRLDHRGYGDYDDFYIAHGSYHLFYTCNDWVNEGLAAAGIRAAMWAPFDVAIFHQLDAR